jgi:hypothetical protein
MSDVSLRCVIKPCMCVIKPYLCVVQALCMYDERLIQAHSLSLGCAMFHADAGTHMLKLIVK